MSRMTFNPSHQPRGRQPKRRLQGNAKPKSRTNRQDLRLEQLEDRTLLSLFPPFVPKMPDLSKLPANVAPVDILANPGAIVTNPGPSNRGPSDGGAPFFHNPLVVTVGPNVLVNNPGEDTTAQDTQSETANLVWGNNVLVAYNDSGSFVPPSGNKFTGYSLSTDGGQTFTDMGSLPTSTDGDLGDPVLARDSVSGRIYFSTLAFSSLNGIPAIQVFRSDDGGQTFMQPVNAIPGSTSNFPDKDWITVDNYAGADQGNVYVSFTDFNSDNITFVRSTDHGDTWSSPVVLAGGADQGSNIVVGPDHSVYVLWWDAHSGQQLMVARSTDGGQTFGAPVSVATLNTTGVNGDLGLNGGFRTNAFPQAAVNPVTGDIYVVYNDDTTGADRGNIYFTQSSDQGATWSAPVQVNDDTTTNDQWQPAISVKPNGTELFIGWYDRRLDPSNSLIDTFGTVGHITGSSVSFEPNFRISEVSFPVNIGQDPVVNPSYMGDYDTASADNGNFFYTWGDNRLPSTAHPGNQSDVRFVRISTGMQVASTTPAAGDIIATAPNDFIVHFSDAYDPTTVDATDLVVNGLTPDSVAMTDASTLTFHFDVSPVTVEGLQSMSMAAGAVTRLSDGDPLQPFSANFRFDTLRLQVTSTDPAAGSVATLPLTTIRVHFNEAYDPATVGTSNLQLSEGTVTAATPVDATTVDYTVSVPNVEGTLNVSLAAGALNDVDGNPMLPFSDSFMLNFGIVPFPTPLTSVNPPGSLIYDPTISGTVGFVGDTETFTLALDPGQTATVYATPDSNLQPTIQLSDPSATVIGSATASGPGVEAVLQTVPINTEGTYTIQLTGGTTTGAYTLHVVLNSALESEEHGGSRNDTPGTAQDLGPSFVNLNASGSAQRGAVLGETDTVGGGAGIGPDAFGYVGSAVTPTFQDISTTGTPTLQGVDDGTFHLDSSSLGTFHFNFYGTDYSDIFFSSNGLITFGSGNSAFFNTNMSGGNPGQAAIAPFWDDLVVTGQPDSAVLWQVVGSGSSQELILQWQHVTFFNGPRTGQLTFEAVLNEADNSIQFNYQNLNEGAAGDGGASATVGIKDVGNQDGHNLLLVSFNSGPNAFVGSGLSTRIQVATATPDFYTFHLNAGDTASLVLNGAGAGAQLALFDTSGTILEAIGSRVGQNLLINNFTAGSEGNYFVRVTGDLHTAYSLVVTRNADFSNGLNTDFTQAQDLSGISTVLGHAAGQGLMQNPQVLFFNDFSIGNHAFEEALANLGITPTVASGYTDFANRLSSQHWDLAILLNQNFNDSTWETAMVNFVNAGGHAIVDSWTHPADVAAAFGSSWTMNDNQNSITQIADPLWAGISNPFNLSNPGWLSFAFGMHATTGRSIGTWGNGDDAIVVGNGGNTIINGFMEDTAANPAEGTQLATNEITALLLAAAPNTYSISARAGDTLHISTTTPADGPGEFSNTFDPKVNVYDSMGTLLASDDNSAPDGRNAMLTFVVPADGTYFIRVLASDLTATPTAGEYVLTVDGATGPVAPFDVTSVSPVDGFRTRFPPTQVTVDFNRSILLTSATAGSLTVDGVPATDIHVVNGTELTFDISVPTEGVHTIHIAAGALTDVRGVGISEFTSHYTIDLTAPRVVGTSIEEGDILPTGDLTYVVTFSEAMNTSALTAADFQLAGAALGRTYSPTSFSYDSTGTVLTIQYSALPDDSYTLTVFSGPGFTDLVGWDLDGEPVAFPIPPNQSGDGVPGGNFFVHFGLDVVGAQPLPTPATPVLPLGGLIYDPAVTSSLKFAGDTDTFTIALDAGQTATVLVHPTGALQPTVTLFDPSGNPIGSAAASVAGGDALLETIAVTTAGTYTIGVGGVAGSTGVYTVQLTLNAALEAELHGGPTNDSRTTAQDLGPSFVNLVPSGAAQRGAVVGAVESLGGGASVGPDAFGYLAQAVTPTFQDISTTGTPVLQGVDDGTFFLSSTALAGFKIRFYGTLYNSIYFSSNGLITFGSGNSEFFNEDLSNDPSQAAISPFWDDLIVTGQPDSAVYWQVQGPGAARQLVLEWKDVTFFNGPRLGHLTFEAILNSADGSIQFNYQSLSEGAAGDGGASATVGIKDAGTQGGNRLLVSFDAGPNAFVGAGLSTLIHVVPAPPPTLDFYSFHLNAGQVATVGLTFLTPLTGSVTLDLLSPSGAVLATGVSAQNLDSVISNFHATTSGTYYARISGQGAAGVQYSLVVTRGAAFDTEGNNDSTTAQDITGTGGVLGTLFQPPGVQVGPNFQGLAFSDQDCGCIPPDNGFAVGPNNVVEGINTAIRIYDKAGNILLTQQFRDFFAPLGTSNLSDPYIVYDDIANRWYVLILDFSSFTFSDILFAASNDSNPMDGFSFQQRIHVGDTDFIDFPKMGFNADAIVITGNDFFEGQSAQSLAVVAIDKTALLGGTFTDYISQRTPGFPDHFRGEVPAWMHGSMPGDPMYLLSENGFENGSAIRVTVMTNILSTSPVFTDTPISVNPYQAPPLAAQPGGGVVVTNDTTFTRADWRVVNGQGLLVGVHTVSEADDGFSTARARWYEIDTTGTPSLVQEGTINPGPGVSTYFGTAAINAAGDIGMTYMQSSATEFISMVVAGRNANDPMGTMAPGSVVAPGTSFGLNFEARAGDYSGIAVDPSDNMTFWGSNEYSGTDPVYNTFIASFQVVPPGDQDWYSLSVSAGETLSFSTSTPGDGPGEFENNADPHLDLYDPSGNLVASGIKLGDGRNEQLIFTAAVGGTYRIRVTDQNNQQGEYVLNATASIAGTVFNDLNGNGTIDPGESGLGGWTVYLDTNNNHRLDPGEPTAVTDSNGNYSFANLAPGVYHVREVVQANWTPTIPPGGADSLTVGTAQDAVGTNFGNRMSVHPLQVIDNRDPLFSVTGTGWSVVKGGFHGDFQRHGPGDGTQTAQWSFGVARGTYELFVTWVASASNSPDATYLIFDGSTQIGSVIVNQQLTPVGLSFGGVPWQSLGIFTHHSKALRIVLSSASDGNVSADAAFVITASPPAVSQSAGSQSAQLIAMPGAAASTAQSSTGSSSALSQLSIEAIHSLPGESGLIANKSTNIEPLLLSASRSHAVSAVDSIFSEVNEKELF